MSIIVSTTLPDLRSWVVPVEDLAIAAAILGACVIVAVAAHRLAFGIIRKATAHGPARHGQPVVEAIRPDIIQFHGREAPEALAVTGAQFDVETWKAVGLGDASALDRATTYKGCADRLLFDAPPTLLPGGNGESFDWALLDEVDIGMPWGLAGGLTPENVAAAIHRTRAPLVDVSSGVESAPGVKDPALIRAFCDAVRAADANR